MGWRDARVEHPIAPSGLQLLRHSHGHEPAAALEDGAPRADARSTRHPARADSPPRRVVVAAGRGVRAPGDGAFGFDAHAVAGVPGGCDPAVRHLPLGLRARRGLSDDARGCYAPHQHGPRQSQNGFLGLHRLGVSAVHVSHLDLSGLQGEKRRRALPARSPEYPLHLGQHVRPADVEPDDGAGARRGAARRHEVGKIWLFSTALLGLVFLGGQVLEFTEFVHKGLTLSTNLFGCTFFVLTGTHGAHVAVGVLWLLTLWVRALQGKLGPANAMTVEITGLYWHFVDVVWIVIFTVVYLIQ